ncbi:hypothetical protein GCM10023144_09460 [Pigmentiphaga soli]|uniref:Dienelactone hydrolase domain-containing protein n=1 Tax=Pigmentiphaga soli TaxID=1007095 RepID=A0ABP8GLK1_9BURK
MAGFIDVQAHDGGAFQGWLAEPEGWREGGHGAVVLLAEAYNVNHWARAVAQRYADEGYVVLAPDLYWRQAPATYLDYSAAAQQVCRAMYARMDFDLAVRDAQSCMRSLRQHPACNGRVGLLGFCLGGKIAFLTAARADPDAAVGYYSIDLGAHFDEVAAIRCPAAFHFGALDRRVPVADADAIRARTLPGQDVQVCVYDRAGHGFGRFGQPTFEADSARLAHAHTLQLFRRALARRPAETQS